MYKEERHTKHAKHNYEECLALVILQDLFPERYRDIALADKPDLQGYDCGVEVTGARDRKMQEAEANWDKAYNTEDEQERKKCIERMAQLGVKYTGGVQAWPGFSPSINRVCEAAKRKMKKVKDGGYAKLKHLELFIYADDYIKGDLKEKLESCLYDYGIDRVFNRVYLLVCGKMFHVFDLETHSYNYIELESEAQVMRSQRAGKLSEGIEL